MKVTRMIFSLLVKLLTIAENKLIINGIKATLGSLFLFIRFSNINIYYLQGDNVKC